MQVGTGPHLMLDCFGCPRDKLADISFITELLENFPAKIGLTRSQAPHAFKYHGRNASDWGVSGVAVTAEAHITVHTFPETQHAFIGIFSSKDFDINAAKQELLQAFAAEDHQLDLINRGPGLAGEGRRLSHDLVGSHRVLH